MILEEFPTIEDFYKTYWGKKPFIVKSAISPDSFDQYIDPDTLAGLSLEEDIKSRIVITEENKWHCEHGPFDEARYSKLGDKNWSLLVQNVEQYHLSTANLLKEFNFAPRWLTDDIMISYSTAGGTIGAHIDSYHVFLVQGMGRRIWRIGHSAIENQDYIEGQDLKVLKNNFDGEEVEVSIGDVIYIPPYVAHEGKTIEEALTFSIGFLGPKLSEILIEYGAYLEENEHLDAQYGGINLTSESSAFQIDKNEIKSIQQNLKDVIEKDSFSKWLANYFSKPTHDDLDNIEQREDQILCEDMKALLESGKILYKPENVKLCITELSNGHFSLAIMGKMIKTEKIHNDLINLLNKNQTIIFDSLKNINDINALLNFITHLYNENYLEFSD